MSRIEKLTGSGYVAHLYRLPISYGLFSAMGSGTSDLKPRISNFRFSPWPHGGKGDLLIPECCIPLASGHKL